MSSNGAVLTAIAVLAGAATAGLASALRQRPYLPGSLAEYDPRWHDALRRAVRQGAAGVQLPVWPGANGELYLGYAEPRRPDPAGADTLRRGVLERLLRRVAATGGAIHAGREEPFELLLELPGEESRPEAALRAFHLLDACLGDHAAILTRWSPAGTVPGPVTVTVTGRWSVRELLAEREERWACVDGTLDDLGSVDVPPTLAPLLSEHWSWRFGWDGRGPMPPEERHLLHWLVRAAHAEGRRVRFFGIPERPRRVRGALWTELSAAGVDVIGSRRLWALRRHLRRRHPVPPGQPLRVAPVSPAVALPTMAGDHPGARPAPRDGPSAVRPPTPEPAASAGTAGS